MSPMLKQIEFSSVYQMLYLIEKIENAWSEVTSLSEERSLNWGHISLLINFWKEVLKSFDARLKKGPVF